MKIQISPQLSAPEECRRHIQHWLNVGLYHKKKPRELASWCLTSHPTLQAILARPGEHRDMHIWMLDRLLSAGTCMLLTMQIRKRDWNPFCLTITSPILPITSGIELCDTVAKLFIIIRKKQLEGRGSLSILASTFLISDYWSFYQKKNTAVSDVDYLLCQ